METDGPSVWLEHFAHRLSVDMGKALALRTARPRGRGMAFVGLATLAVGIDGPRLWLEHFAHRLSANMGKALALRDRQSRGP